MSKIRLGYLNLKRLIPLNKERIVTLQNIYIK